MNVNMPNRFSQAALRTYVLVMLFGLVPISARVAKAQGHGIEGASNSSLPRVMAVNGRIEVGQIITIDVDHLSNWSASHDPRKLVLYLNGRALTGLYPEEVNLSENRLIFHLQRTPESKQEWENLLHEPVLRRLVSVSVGLEHQSPFDTVFDYDRRLTFTVIPTTWAMISLAVVLGILVLLVYLATHTNILRDPGPSPATGGYRPYDLGRVQTAFWFFLVSMSYLCIWLITGDIDSLTPATLGLLGISAATALGPQLIRDARNDTDQPVAALESSSSGAPSGGFVTDILSDANGYGFHRFQMVLWTILLGIIFVSSVYDNLAMPKFGAPLLALMGISAGTYLGFELMGNKSTLGTLGDQQGVVR